MSNPLLPSHDSSTDPHLWLEDVTGEEALSWVKQRNAATEEALDSLPLTAELEREILDILDAKDKIPGVTKRGDYLYNFWTDAEHERGLWRRTTLESYRSESPEWDVLIDVDALNEAEGEDWVWHGATGLRPREGEPYRRFLVSLSHGGSDADVTREWDLETRSFVEEAQGGFYRPEAKGSLSWIDEDTVWVTTDFGDGTTSSSGYALQARVWKRGTPLAEAKLVHSGSESDMGVFAYHDSTPGWERDIIHVMHTFYTSSTLVVDLSGEPRVRRVDVPEDMQVSIHRDLILLEPRSEWEIEGSVYPQGSLLVANAEDFLAGRGHVKALFTPTESTSLLGLTVTRDFLVLTTLDDVRHRLTAFTRNGDEWHEFALYGDLTGALSVAALDSEDSNDVWVTVDDFTTPLTLMLGSLDSLADTGEAGDLETIKTTPERFDSTGVEVSQHFAISEDGTRIPYFQIAKKTTTEGPRPTLLYGYGGFEVSLTPSYLAATGKAWVERGGVYVLANIRGGGEYGPRWHQGGLKENRHRVYEDFSGVAKDLIERGVTDSSRLAVRGGSNGGLLTGNMITQYPELFGAVIIQVPLLDMKRFSHLLAGASWMAEYGDPDTDDWEFIKTFSPYHLLKEGVVYPPAFVLTSTRDDRVHPGHARKFAAALESLGAPVSYWENTEGGHGGAASNAQAARMNALIHAFLWNTIGKDS